MILQSFLIQRPKYPIAVLSSLIRHGVLMIKTTPCDLLEQLISKAKSSGADSADAMFVENRSLSVAQRLGKPETIEKSEATD